MWACNGSAWGFLLLGYPRSWSPVYHEKISTETSAMNCSVHVTRAHSCVVQSRQNNRTICLPSGSAWPGPSFPVKWDCAIVKENLRKLPRGIWSDLTSSLQYDPQLPGKCPVDLVLGYHLIILQTPISNTTLLHQLSRTQKESETEDRRPQSPAFRCECCDCFSAPSIDGRLTKIITDLL